MASVRVSSKAFKSAVTKFHEVKKTNKNRHENRIHTVVTGSDWNRKLGTLNASGGANAGGCTPISFAIAG